MATDSKLIEAGITSSRKMVGTRVENIQGEHLGKIEDVMIDTGRGRVAYAVLSFGGFMGVGNKLFAFPWSALRVHGSEKAVLLNVSKESLQKAPGFDKENWPDMNDRIWGQTIHSYYKVEPYWK